MAINHKIPETLFDKLNKLDNMFYLTGSHFFGVNRIGSDFDYFAQYSKELVRMLISMGFSSVYKTKYADSLAVAVLRAVDPFTNIQIDIQLVSDVKRKHQIQEKFKSLGITKPTKEQWNLALLLVAA